MIEILIGTDFWGAGNFGDDLMLAGFARWVERYAPHWRISVLCAHDIDAMRHRFPRFRWLGADEAQRRKAIAQADLWLGLGGAVFQTDVGPWILDRVAADLMLAAERGIPAFLVGVGLNNDEAAHTEQARTIHHLSTAIWTRDAHCRDRLLAAGLCADKLHPGADTAHLACADLHASRPLAGSAACLIAPPGQVDAQALVQSMRARAPRPVWLCQEVRPLEGSEGALYAAMPESLRQQLELCQPDYRHATLADIFQAFARFETVLSSRYHMTLLAAWAGSRLAVFERNSKLTGIRTELGLPQCHSLNDSAALEQALRDAQPAAQDRLQACAQRAARMLEDFAAAAGAALGQAS